MTIVPAGWRSVLVKTSVYDHGRSQDFREEVWRGPWPEVEAVTATRDNSLHAFVSLNHGGERWSSILFPSVEGWVCLGADASHRLRHGTLDPAVAFFSTTFTFTRGATERVPADTARHVRMQVDQVARWRAGDVSALLSRRIARWIPEESPT